MFVSNVMSINAVQYILRLFMLINLFDGICIRCIHGMCNIKRLIDFSTAIFCCAFIGIFFCMHDIYAHCEVIAIGYPFDTYWYISLTIKVMKYIILCFIINYRFLNFHI